MYISITDFTWCENENEVFVSIPLKGLGSKHWDVFASSLYIKITLKPYIFECALRDRIVVERSKVVITGGIAEWKLIKENAGLWNSLQSDAMNDKALLMQIRQDAIVESQSRESENTTKKRNERRLGEKTSLHAMMKIEGDERKRCEEIKKTTTMQAMQELVQLQEEQKQLGERKATQMREALAFAREQRPETHSLCAQFSPRGEIFSVTENAKVDVPVRDSNRISVAFTPRLFPTPGRESMKRDEETWLENAAEHRRCLTSRVAVADDLSEAERDPFWLQKKAGDLFKAGDFEAAAFAYSEALKRAPKLSSLYLNRAACYLQSRNFFKALEDSSMALDLLQPPVPQNLKSRVKAHVRRAVAFCNLEMLKEGISEYEAAAKLDPGNQTILNDLQNLKDMRENPKQQQQQQNHLQPVPAE